MDTQPFLTAEWRDLVVLNYEVDPDILLRYIPPGIELDLWDGRAIFSVVAFKFLRTRVRKLAIPFHTNFIEVNLRFYVSRTVDGERRRGVVFIKELVPRRAIAAVARLVYNENYFHAPLLHESREGESERFLKYGWKDRGTSNTITATAFGALRSLQPGSEESFILEHYWGYSRTRAGKAIEYEVRHPPWLVWDKCEASLEIADNVYGAEFSAALKAAPRSAVVAQGSAVSVYPGRIL